VLEDDRARDLINTAAEAARAGAAGRANARGLLQRALATSPSIGLRIRAWRNLASLAETAAEKRECLENILLADPTDGLARRDLAILDGTLRQSDVVDPDHSPRQPPDPPVQDVETEQAVCTACGAGRMVYSPSSGRLVCAHCGLERPVADNRSTATANDDFAVAMWTAKARRAPTAQQVVTCSRCGATFVVKPGILSIGCLYCGTNATIQQARSRDLVPPDSIVPLSVTREEARHLVESADKTRSARDVSGGYVPIWVFSFAGQVDWTGLAHRQFGDSDRPEVVDGTYTVLDMSVPVFGSSRLAEFADLVLPHFDFAKAVPFDEKYLTGWPAESYDITLELASVAARPRAIEKTRAEVIESTRDEATGIKVSTGSLGIDTFRLVLAPVWLVSSADDRPSLVVNGCTGQVYAKSGPGILDRLRRSLGMD
jgi:hypothetical protein